MLRLSMLIKELLEEIEELEETSTSAATPGYQTPNAFGGGSAAGKAKARQNSEQAGYKLIGKLEDGDN